jgi:hypothetical protein
MCEPWVILMRRYGEETENPTPTQLAEAIAELYHETLPGMCEGDYAEHGPPSCNSDTMTGQCSFLRSIDSAKSDSRNGPTRIMSKSLFLHA